jgi:Arc/MetJ family transcription regulator
MRKTTVLINDDLLKTAAEIVGTRTKKETIEVALQALVRQHTREKLRKELGTFDIDLTPEELERLRNAG